MVTEGEGEVEENFTGPVANNEAEGPAFVSEYVTFINKRE